MRLERFENFAQSVDVFVGDDRVVRHAETNDTATTEIYTVSDTLSLHDALPICLALLCAMTFAFASAGNASAQTPSIIGSWSLVWEGARDNYTGTLRVTAGKNDKVFDAKLNLVKSDGTKIAEDAKITVSGDEVRIECSNPSFKGWNPDRFYVVRKDDRMEGYSLDTAGQRGQKIVFNRR